MGVKELTIHWIDMKLTDYSTAYYYFIAIPERWLQMLALAT